MNNTIASNSAISGAGSSSATPPTALAQDKLNFNDFLKLMTSQLENQDPLNPTSNAEYFAQIAQLGTVQGIDTLNNSSQVQQAQSLMGKTVIASNPNASATGGSPIVTGVVQNLSIQNGAYYLGIQTADGSLATVPITSLQSVQATPDLSNQSDLVGKTVTGPVSVGGKVTQVTGTVTDVSMVNGLPVATVQVGKKQSVSIAVSNLSSVSD